MTGRSENVFLRLCAAIGSITQGAVVEHTAVPCCIFATVQLAELLRMFWYDTAPQMCVLRGGQRDTFRAARLLSHCRKMREEQEGAYERV